MATRYQWKYACSRSVFETPTVMINGVALSLSTFGWTVPQWVAFLKEVVPLRV